MKNYIVSNQIQCNNCGDKPFSQHVHDYRSCSCGSCAVDGGQEYLRRTFSNAGAYKELSIEISEKTLAFLESVYHTCMTRVDGLQDDFTAAYTAKKLIQAIVLEHKIKDLDMEKALPVTHKAVYTSFKRYCNAKGVICAVYRELRDLGYNIHNEGVYNELNM